MNEYIELRTISDVSEDILRDAYEIFEGWFADEHPTGSLSQYDWEVFFDRLETGASYDFGSDWDSPAIKYVKKMVRKYAREEL